MKITDIHVEGFGVWRKLNLSNLSGRLTAFYGANEAGKTTLMQFIRCMMYGVSARRRQRYLPPLEGGRPGGAVGIADGDVEFRLSRFADRGPSDAGVASITTADGHSGGDRLLREALVDVDETTFNNIFAVGLSEIQELGTLSDTQAAEWLYRLTSGVDRVSLYDVIRNLRETRRDLLSGKDRESRILQLVAHRDALQGEIQQLSHRNRNWSQIAVRIKELDGEISCKEAEVRDCEHHARTIEIAVGLKPNWRKREKIARQLEQYAGTISLPDDAIERLDQLGSKLAEHQREASVLEGQRKQLKEESERLGINELLVKAACRIDALGEQRDWLQSLERQKEDLEAEAEEFEERLASEQERLGSVLGLADRNTLKEISSADLEGLQPHIEEIRSAQKQVDDAQRQLDALTENERSLQVKIESATIDGEHYGLPMDLQKASDLVAGLRKRLQVEQRLEQARSHEVEMEQQSHDLLDDQVMPLGLFNWTLAAVVMGGLLTGVWLWLPNSPLGSTGGLIAVGALSTVVFCFIFKFFTEDAAAEKLDGCQRQMEVLARQIKEAEQEKKQLDADLPMTDGSVALRMQAAERHLAELEKVLPVEAQRKQAGHEVSTAESRLASAHSHLDKALSAWRTKIVGLGFSEKLDPQKFLTVSERHGALSDLEGRAKLRRDEVAMRQREHAALTRRVHDLAQEVGCVLESEEYEEDDDGEQYEVEVGTLDQLEQLLSAKHQQLSHIQRRDELRQRARQLKAQEAKHRRAIVGVQRRRDALLQAADCDDEAAYRRLADDQKQIEKLRQLAQEVSREIAAGVGSHAPEESFAELLASPGIEQLDQQWEAASRKLEETQDELKSLVGSRGELRQEQRSLAEDRSLAERQLELSCAEKQLSDARQAWREHAVVNRVLERIRADYEAHRQPETLAEASGYLAKLTGGQYKRVWTPLANDVLLVENSAGDSLGVDVLSRGTREQLFLSVRLALVANFARRGVKLPMVLDDVLVNFDAARAQQAAEVLCEFAARGHQLLVFTCHEHMWQMFNALDVDCRRLPLRSAESGGQIPPTAETNVQPPVEPEPMRQTDSTPPPTPVDVGPESVPPEPADYYEYPFVEKIEIEQKGVPEAARAAQETPPESPAVAEVSYDWSSNRSDIERQDDAQQAAPAGVKGAAGSTVAYIVAGESVSGRAAVDTTGAYRDHLATRRA